MTRDEVTEAVLQIVSDQFGVDQSEIGMGTQFINDLSADSLDAVELTMEMEDEFAIGIPDGDVEKIVTVDDAISYIVRRVSG